MKILHSSIKGNVYKTNESVGYSPRKIFNQLYDFLKTKCENIKYDFSKNNSSYYLEFVINNISYEIRISNHTKRGIDYITEMVTVNTCEVYINPMEKDLGVEDY